MGGARAIDAAFDALVVLAVEQLTAFVCEHIRCPAGLEDAVAMTLCALTGDLVVDRELILIHADTNDTLPAGIVR